MPRRKRPPEALDRARRPPEVAGADRGGGLDLDTDDSPCRVLHYDVHLLAVLGPEVEESGLGVAPGRLLLDLHRDEVLQQGADEDRVGREPLGT